MVRVSVAVQLLAVVVLCPFMVMVEIKKENHHLAQHARRGQWQLSLDDDDGHKQQFIASFGLEVGLLQVDGGEAERRLLNTLMEQYNKLERPVYNESQAVQLKFGLTLQQIIDVVSARTIASHGEDRGI